MGMSLPTVVVDITEVNPGVVVVYDITEMLACRLTSHVVLRCM
jgi:hypothetical protein